MALSSTHTIWTHGSYEKDRDYAIQVHVAGNSRDRIDN